MLIIFGGLPGSGKTTLSRALAERLAAVHVRVDTIEHALRGGRSEREDIGVAGYVVAYAVAEDNLRLGHTVVADAVNPVPETRKAWQEVAVRNSVTSLSFEVVCSNAGEHRRRVETRTTDIAGFVGPNWAEVEARDYRPWPEADLVVDTASRSPDACVADLIAFLRERGIPTEP